MTSDKTYNGWSNYETWNVKLWMDNDEGSYHFWQEQTEYWIKKALYKDKAVNSLAEALKAQHEENVPELNGTYADLLNAALSEVDWYEIAESLVNDAIAKEPELAESWS